MFPDLTPVRLRNFRKIRAKAFSLVEVCLALGIVCSILIPLLGLTMVGLHTLNESQVEVRCATIAQRLIASAQMLPYGELQKREYALDAEGMLVEREADAVLRATLQPSRDSVVDIPASSGVTCVSVTITGPALANKKRVYSSLVANMDSLNESAN